LPSISSTLYVQILRTNVISAAFFYIQVTRKKAAEMTFVRKIRAFNVDEIDTKTTKLAFGFEILAPKISYKKRARKMLMKLTPTLSPFLSLYLSHSSFIPSFRYEPNAT
jgi:hypothetical protein